MSENELTLTPLVNVVQLPIIEERLYAVKSFVEQEVEQAMSLVCTEETVQAVKQTRADLNKQFAELETMRKNVKAAVMEPYKGFEAVYEECVAKPFKQADGALKGKVEAVETEQKQRCEQLLRSYFDECCVAYNVDFIRFEQAGIKIDMASAKAKTPKRLMEQVRSFVETVGEQTQMIMQLPEAEEVMVEFKQSLNAAAAIGAVSSRKKRLEEERAAAAQRMEVQKQRREAEARVRAVAPAVVEEPEPLISAAFVVTDTLPRLKMLKAWLEANGYRYE